VGQDTGLSTLTLRAGRNTSGSPPVKKRSSFPTNILRAARRRAMPLGILMMQKCQGKIQHESKENAEKHAASLSRRNKTQYGRQAMKPDVFECPVCGYWHVGFKRKKGKTLNR
jgi:hypothetical protein